MQLARTCFVSTRHIYGRGLPILNHLQIRSNGSMEGDNKRKADKLRDLSPPPIRKQKIESSTTRDAVNSFFTPASSKQAGRMTWITESTLLAGHFQSTEELEGRSRQRKRQKIAAFDFDSTLIKSASGKRFSGIDDWMWWHPSVPKRVKQLDADGYQVVILSNQSGLNLDPRSKTAKTDQKKVDEFKNKVTTVTKKLDVSLSFYAATERDKFRKPRTGMWLELLDHFDLDGSVDAVDMENSLFVGDAGGRTKDEASGKDFSSSDRDFSVNVGISFQTPEEFFLGEPSRAFERVFDPQEYITRETSAAPFTKINKQDVVVFCGSPGAGKSTFYWNYLAPLGYERVNQDKLKTRDKCLQVAEQFLKAGRSVAVDNTNADPETRAYWIELSRKHQVPVRTVVFKTQSKLCEHNDAVRALNGTLMNPEGRTRLPEIAFLGFAKRFREPRLEEGFQDIVMVDFKFAGNDEQKAAWTQYYV